MQRIWDGKTYAPYRPWSEERKRAASIRMKRHIALKRKAELEAELTRVRQTIRDLDRAARRNG